MACFADVLYQVLTSKKVDHIFSISNLLIKPLFRIKKTVVVIYKVMYMVHCENTFRIEAIECISNESLR